MAGSGKVASNTGKFVVWAGLKFLVASTSMVAQSFPRVIREIPRVNSRCLTRTMSVTRRIEHTAQESRVRGEGHSAGRALERDKRASRECRGSDTYMCKL
jgi:hypothetical protein